MESPPYCKACFAAIAGEELPEDTARLHELDHYWAIQSAPEHTLGTCARCGKQGDVVVHKAESRLDPSEEALTMNGEEEKMRVIIEYFTKHFPPPYTLEAVPITRPQSTVHDDRKLRVLLDGTIAHSVIVSSALLSDTSPDPTRLVELLEEKLIADKLKRSHEFRLNHYELGTESPNL